MLSPYYATYTTPTYAPYYQPTAPTKPRQKKLQNLFAPNRTPGSKKRFVVLGDNGSGTQEQFEIAGIMAELYKSFPFASVLVLGDNVYGDTKHDDGHPRLFEQRIHEPYQTLFDQGVKFYPVLGNHDVSNGFEEDQLDYWDVPRYYKVSQGPVDFFALDTTLFFPDMIPRYRNDLDRINHLAGKQLQWLERKLNQSRAPFKVVYGHYPMYASGDSRMMAMGELMREKFEHLLDKHDVDLYLAGHQHFYEDNHRINGVTHITTGGGGMTLDPAYRTKHTPQGDRRDTIRHQNHFMMFTIHDDYLRYHVISKDGKIIDKGRINKQ